MDYTPGSDKKFRVRLLPEALAVSLVLAPRGKLDVAATFSTGIMTFKSRGRISTLRGNYNGVNYGRAFIYTSDSIKNHVIAHEVIHEFQYREFMVFNAFLKPQADKMQMPGLKKSFYPLYLSRYTLLRFVLYAGRNSGVSQVLPEFF